MDFEIDFKDITLLESEGRFEEVNKIMKKETFGGDSWMIASEVIVSSSFGSSVFTLHLYHNKDVYIMDFQSTSGQEAFYNTDIPCISSWAQEYGWNLPKPCNDLVRTQEDLWKFFWETGIVNSELLVQRFGERECDYIDDNEI